MKHFYNRFMRVLVVVAIVVLLFGLALYVVKGFATGNILAGIVAFLVWLVVFTVATM